MSSKVIAPGDSGNIQVSFNTRYRTGDNVKTVKVYTNAGNDDPEILTIKAKVKK